MSLSAEQIQWLKETEPTYGYVGDDVRDLSLSCFVAPTRVGKSTLISAVAALAHDELSENGLPLVGEVNTITTRERRPNEDPKGYRTANEGITFDGMLERINNRELINWRAFETGDIYGTDRLSYPAQHNLLPTMSEAIPMLGRVAFASMHIIYVVRPIDDWKREIPEKIENPKQLGRIIEAKKSLIFGRNSRGLIRVVNYKDEDLLERTAKGLLEIVTTNEQDYRSGTLDDYHDREFEIHHQDMENHVDELLRKAGVEEVKA